MRQVTPKASTHNVLPLRAVVTQPYNMQLSDQESDSDDSAAYVSGRRTITDWSTSTFRVQESTLFGIELPLICRKFIDTNIFQRMRFIKQT